MYTIILDSSNKMLCVALAEDDSIIDRTEYEAWQKQSELMIPELDKLLKKNNITRHDIGDIIVSNGPGSYTGVRIAVTIAKIMSIATNAKVYAVSSLESQKLCKTPTICLINARSNRSYIGVYDDDKIILKDNIFLNEGVKKYISEHPDYKITGDIEYLGLKSEKYDVADGLLRCKNASHLVENVLALKPVYMKD